MKVSGQSSGTEITLESEDIRSVCQMLQQTEHTKSARISISADGEVRVNGHRPPDWQRIRHALLAANVPTHQVNTLTVAALNALNES